MPEMYCYELARAIRAREKGARRIPIVACTANAGAAESSRCIEAGMDDFVAKPVELDSLAKVMERWLPLPQSAEAGIMQQPSRDRADEPDAPVDRASLAQVSGGDAVMEREILADFRSANDADLEALRAALGRRDLAQVVKAAHRAKGACRTVGAAALAEVCERIEA